MGGAGGCEAGAAAAAGTGAKLCNAEFKFAAIAAAELPFVCTITGLLPGLLIAIGTAMFAGWTWTAAPCAPAA